MATLEQARKSLASKWASTEEFRGDHPFFEESIRGEFMTQRGSLIAFNDFPRGKSGKNIDYMVSRTVVQGDPIDPTIGVLPKGRYEFSTGPNMEEMFAVEGRMYVREKGKRLFTPQEKPKGEIYTSTNMPAGTTFEIEIRDKDVYYVCFYKPTKQGGQTA